MWILPVFALLLFTVAVFLLVRSIAGSRGSAGQTLQQIGAYGFAGSAPEEPDQRASMNKVAASIGGRMRGSRFSMNEAEMQRLLIAAGMYLTSPDRVLGYQVVSSVGLGVLTLWLGGVGGVSVIAVILFTVLGAVVGWLLPLAVIRRRIRLRQTQIERDLPDFIDLVVVSVEAGLSFPGAIRIASDRVRGALGEEIRLTLQEQNMGLGLEDAMLNLLGRVDTPGMAIFVRSIVQGHALGVSMGQIMRNIANELRKRRKASAEERAQKAPVKMLFPLVFLIFPALFVVILLPAMLSIAKGLG